MGPLTSGMAVSWVCRALECRHSGCGPGQVGSCDCPWGFRRDTPRPAPARVLCGFGIGASERDGDPACLFPCACWRVGFWRWRGQDFWDGWGVRAVRPVAWLLWAALVGPLSPCAPGPMWGRLHQPAGMPCGVGGCGICAAVPCRKREEPNARPRQGERKRRESAPVLPHLGRAQARVRGGGK